MHVLIEVLIEQVEDGTHYKGYVIIGKSHFTYDLELGIPISLLGDARPVVEEAPEENLQLFQLILKRDGEEIQLSEHEFGFFLMLIMQIAVEYYYNPMTRSNNEMGLTPAALHERESHRLPPELHQMLNQPKFGCSLDK